MDTRKRKPKGLFLAIMLLPIALAVLAAATGGWPASLLSASTTTRGPDLVLVVESRSGDAAEALRETSRRVGEVVEAASQLGAGHEQVTTAGVSVIPQPDASGLIVGYRAVNQVVVTGADLRVAEALERRALELGARTLNASAGDKDPSALDARANWDLQWLQLG